MSSKTNRQVIQNENNLEILKGLALHILENNEILAKEISDLREQEAESRQRELELEYQRTVLRNLVFGRGTERGKDREQRSKEDKTTLLHSQSLVPTPTEEEKSSLAEDVIYHGMTGEDLIREAKDRGLASRDEKSWVELKGLTEDSTEVTVIERLYKLNQHKRKKYRYHPQAGEDLKKEVIVTALGPEKLVAGGGYSIDFALSVVRDKYEYHMPLERQTREMEANGLRGIGTKTLYNLVQAISVHMEKVLPLIGQDIFAAGVAVHCDETPWHIYGRDDDGYMWVMSNQAGGMYRFEPTRSGRVAREMLKGYKGPVLMDGYGGYSRLKKVKGITVGHCWSHARRKFYEIRDLYPEETEEILQLMKELFKVEHEAKSYEELKRLRREQSGPFLDEIKRWMLENISRHLPESPFTKAIRYTLGHWDGLKAFLYDVRIPLTNNDAERAVRHAVMGRKNFYGSQTINGADVAAILYTVIESCKRVELDPTSYMRQVILHNNRGEAVESPLEYARRIREKSAA